MCVLLLAGCAGCAGCASGAGGSGGVDAELDAEVDAARLVGDGLPQGAVSFFRAPACPAGWEAFGAARGRTIVPEPEGADAGVPGRLATEGAPLTSGEMRSHEHGITGSVSVPATQFVGVAGAGNGNLGGAGTAPLTGSTDSATAVTPYTQLLVCEKTAVATAGAPAPPRGLLLFFPGGCPTGWSRAGLTGGRYLIALPRGGSAGIFGGNPLGTGERREHSHAVTGSVSTTSHGIALASGCCANGYAQNGTYQWMTTTGGATAGLPYIQLLQCQKD